MFMREKKIITLTGNKYYYPLGVVKKCVNYYQPTPEKHRGFVDGVKWPTPIETLCHRKLFNDYQQKIYVYKITINICL